MGNKKKLSNLTNPLDKSTQKQKQQVSSKILTPQSLDDNSHSQEQNDQSVSEQYVEAAVKSMKFRQKRGTRMIQLMTGKFKFDNFWEVNGKYFGGVLNFPEQDDSQDDSYQQSSSGRDQFDSDFDQSDSYPGKRGRRKNHKSKAKSKSKSKGPKKSQKSQIQLIQVKQTKQILQQSIIINGKKQQQVNKIQKINQEHQQKTQKKPRKKKDSQVKKLENQKKQQDISKKIEIQDKQSKSKKNQLKQKKERKQEKDNTIQQIQTQNEKKKTPKTQKQRIAVNVEKQLEKLQIERHQAGKKLMQPNQRKNSLKSSKSLDCSQQKKRNNKKCRIQTLIPLNI